ncbi:exosome 3'-5' exoribonuclease subunit Dis3 [Schizosaccharomyces pombe]|uniref:Exosome complex exonuclease dis3 n=1 Tax=Schizosaccharomyces pombe (strain 972 / ATCC 24843) TaxID=284812 RepID=DIS3_SCHPO|nr:putative 3'-5' exoribonuclease subunit Dis3 [Schizosaccharomyces pombe]P37202.1 RecName: Full=Exosome complex exonuclease dis3; AltName: Full=Chromosome disjunction protein 3; AltName: Full=Mitotic control protein dis3; AltName: Full=Ribosomal RNA-processing protein 44 [Schizosaccharomyces pombe 972h-]AAA35302.1 mitotic control protein [Schizosaccharomyces pombe]CAA21102.1 3'-5' exoribonuclease subunit Dis3 (predicted) [Schizosaccharomyces pombe]|eukprot:NP_596653.1 putative 3'-5' exoribonuclease subunit Dis3 [Schizosaccharomyces pombe]
MSTVSGLKRPQSSEKNHRDRVFVRATRGKVQKVVREQYLRNDIPCQSRACPLCRSKLPKDSRGNVLEPILSEKPMFLEKFGHHYLIPDSNIFYHCIDALEHPNNFFDVIILQTVFSEISSKSIPLYNRMKRLCQEKTKRFTPFSNEFFVDTFVERLDDESANDRNDRAIRNAASWFASHLASLGIKIVLLTDDRENARLAAEQGIQVSTLKDYVQYLPDSEILLDMVSAIADAIASKEQVESGTKNVYELHWSMSRLLACIKNGEVHKGLINISTYNYLEGSVVVPGYNKPVLVSGRENLNRAVQGDIVCIQILPQDQWKTEAEEIADDDEDVVVSTAAEPDSARINDLELITKRNAHPTAKVVGILKRNWRPYVGHVDNATIAQSKGGSQQTVLLTPMDRRVPKIRFRTRQAPRLVGRRIVVAIDLWDASSRYPEGHFVRDLGEMETKEAETEALLLEYDVQHRPFPKAVLDCLPEEGHNWKVPADKTHPLWKNRKDFRDKLICSIDPPGCQDIDDALHACVLPNGNYEVGVHIADVTHFVKPNTSMDSEAASRGTTVYLVDKRIDMLPMLLGTDLCSLRPYVERFAFSCIWEMDENANIIKVHFTKSVIASKEAFSYADAQARIDDQKMQDPLTQGMRVLLKLSKILKQKRMDEGALNLASPEVRIQTDNETSDPMDVEIKQLLETNSLVEEFMLLANISVAQKIYDAFPQTAVLRRHAAPPLTNFDSLQDILRVCKGMHLKCDTSKSLAKSLDECVDPKEPYFNTLLRILTTRCMLSAEYFCSGTFAPPDFRHYGLASPIYTHFTSPIRRYADVLAHRQLAAAIDYETINPSLSDKSRLIEICNGINYRHRMAQMAGRASIEYYVGQALKGGVAEEDAYVIKVFKNGFVVFIARFGLEGIVYTKSLSSVLEPNVEYVEDEYKLNIEIRDQPKPQTVQIQMFQQVRVRVTTVRDEHSGKQKVQITLVY